MLYKSIKLLIESGRVDGLPTKIETFYRAGKLSQIEYEELLSLLEKR